MTLGRTSLFKITVVLLAIALPLTALAQPPIGKPYGGGASIEFQMNVSGHDRIEMTVLSPAGETYSRTFPAGRPISFRLLDLGANPEDGQYNYQLTLVPKVSEGTKKKLADAREAGDDAQIKKIQREEGLDRTSVLSGTFTILNGSIVNPDGVEGDANDSASAATAGPGRVSTDGASADSITRGRITVLDQVIPDDLIVQSSICAGFDCVDGESFGADTLRLKENNLRINFEDTSTSAGYASNDWRIIANDQPSGGANKFSIEDSTAARNPMTIEAGAPANALYVDSTGNIGLQQSAPGLDLHLTMSDTPAIRLEQTNAGGFTAQTWDIGGNEANFFIRDLTSGSRLPFRIRPGAPTSSIDINASGQVGIGTASPKTGWGMLQVSSSDPSMSAMFGTDLVPMGFFRNGAAAALYYNAYYNAGDKVAFGTNYSGALQFNVSTGLLTFRNTSASGATDAAITWNDRFVIDRTGRVGIGNTAPTQPLMVGVTGSGVGGNGAYVTAGGVWTTGSSRASKQNIEELDVAEAKAAVAALHPVRYNYKGEPEEQYVGFIAEDVPELVAQTSSDRKVLSAMDVVATLTKVVQDQQKTIDELSRKVEQLSNEQ